MKSVNTWFAFLLTSSSEIFSVLNCLDEIVSLWEVLMLRLLFTNQLTRLVITLFLFLFYFLIKILFFNCNRVAMVVYLII